MSAVQQTSLITETISYPVKWIRCEKTENVLSKLGIQFSIQVVDPSLIDRNESSKNIARPDKSIDADRVQQISKSMLARDPIPMPVLREVGYSYWICGGNHREGGNTVVGAPPMTCYVIKCSDSMFKKCAKLLNCHEGEGISKEQRLEWAVDDIEKENITVKEAADQYGVSEAAVKHKKRERHNYAKVSSRLEGCNLGNASRSKILRRKGIVDVLAGLQADSVFKAAVQYAAYSGELVGKVTQDLRSAKNMGAEQKQLQFIKQRIADASATSDTKKRSPEKVKFLKGLSTLETVLTSNVRTLLDLDIHDTNGEMRARCQKLAGTLNSL